MRGVEPPHLSAPDPKSGVSANFTTSAQEQYNGTPERIRTFDRTLRRRVLYPAELRTHKNKMGWLMGIEPTALRTTI